MTCALIFAGGSGSRINSRARPKQFLQFYGKELILYTLENFQSHPDVDAIAIACVASWIPRLEKLLAKNEMTKVKAVVPGGDTGQQSIRNALLAIKAFAPEDSVILVHDGVRPFVTEELISQCILSTRERGSAIAVCPSIETIVTIEGGKISTITDRSKCFHARAPQCFLLKDLLAAHERAEREGWAGLIDSATLMRRCGHELYAVQCGFDNIKITTPQDFYTFKALYEAHEQQQIFGFQD